MTTLIVSPESYPWDLAKEQTFLEPELAVFAKRFEKVIVVPQQIGGQRAQLPAGVELDESYAREAGALSLAQLAGRASASSLMSEDLLRRARDLVSVPALKRLIAFAGRAHLARGWARRFLGARRLEGARSVFYTFWWGATTTGFGLARRGHSQMRVVSRAHGFDLYEERHTPAYLPCRHRSAKTVDALFPDSDQGRDYLVERLGSALGRCETARLGISDPRVTCKPSVDGALRVVSCSVQVPVKRLDLLVEGLAQAGKMIPGRKIEWTHFGTGALQPELERQVAAQFPANATARFAGYSSQRALFDWYAAHPVDVFVNVSASEGTPVSIMEAIACGIPILATAVGGNPEIATEANGLRLPANPTAAEVAAALLRFGPGAEAAGWRAGSTQVWRERYDADANYERFARTLDGV
jgi:colanic acid/amylovoran biosynthesis glycosyltransferase